MKFCGIISEFNPFHNGHRFIIQEAKKQTGAEILCLMSGDFVQRGEPAITDKYTRAEIAIKNGANAVLELPTIYAVSNAENFAYGAIKIFNALNIDYLAFGIENTNLETLQKIAELKVENSSRFKLAFKNEIENGINFNTALKRSISKTLNDASILKVLEKPNNILAIEYLTAILKSNSKIKPIAINRTDNGFFDENPNGLFLSASAIRNLIFEQKNIDDYIPKNAKFSNFFHKNHIKTLNCLQILKIKQLSEVSLKTFYDYSEGIEYRIKKAINQNESFDEINNFICTPRYRKPRVNKLLLYPLLNITKKLNLIAKDSKPFAKILAIQKSNKTLLSSNKKKINLIASNNDYNLLNKNQKKLIQIDLDASQLYNTIFDNQNIDDMKKGTQFL